MIRSLFAGMRRHVALLLPTMGRQVALSIGLTIAGGALELAAVVALLLVLAAVGVDMSAGNPAALAARGRGLFDVLNLQATLELSVAAYAAVVIVQAALQRLQTIVNLDIEYRFIARLRTQLFDAVASANWPFLARTRGADLSHALTTEVDRVGLATYQLLWTAATATTLAAQVIIALRVSVALTVLVGAAAALLVLALTPRMRRARLRGEAISAATADVHAMAIEQLAGMKTVKSQAIEHTSAREFAVRSESVARAASAAAREQADARASFDIGAALLLALILMLAVRWFAAPPATVLILVFLCVRVMPRVSALQQGLHQYGAALPSLFAVESARARCAAAREDLTAGSAPLPFTREIRLADATFGYDPALPVINDVSLAVAQGETTALVGPSGGGKTTVADLVMGLLTPQRGSVQVDDHVLGGDAVASWRASIGYVSQDSFFFHDTIGNNLRVAAPGATDLEIEQALRSAACDFVAGMPAGLDTIVGDRGIRLSGGERQRLALARALVRQPQLLILDEATSALDTEHEQRIFEAIDGLHGRLTILLITHRVWTLRRVDTIHVLEAGRLVESGRWDTLRSTAGSRFAALSMAGDALASPRPGTSG